MLKTAFDHRPPARASLRDGVAWLGRVASSVVEPLVAFRQARLRKRAEAELMGLDDRMLKDIGLSRSRIEAAVNGDLPQDSYFDPELP